MAIAASPAAAGAAAAAPVATNNTLEEVAKSFFAGIQQQEKNLLTKTGAIPKQLDVELLKMARQKLGRMLTDTEKPQLRAELRKLI